ncbi:MAG: uridine kinase [Phenylobacterium sp.]|jgi:uridine kinase
MTVAFGREITHNSALFFFSWCIIVSQLNPSQFNTTVIAIAGASASGKTLFADTIYQELIKENALGEGGIAFISEDSYYRDQSEMTMSQRVKVNYDHPDAFEHQLMVEHIDALKNGQTIELPIYSYTEHTRTDKVRKIKPARIILVEGIMLLTSPQLRTLFDIQVFMDTPLDICLIRRISRDMQERGRTFDSIVNQYEKTVRPMYFEFIERCRQMADIVVTKGGKNRTAIELIKAKINQLLVD